MLGLLAAALLFAGPPADRLFVNGRVYTGDAARPHAQALAVRGDRIVAVGTDARVRRLRGPRTEVVDLGGRRVVPGFIDSHLHFLVVPVADLASARDLGEVQRRIRAWADSKPGAAWVTGRGWTYAAFPGGLPHRGQLDAVVADRPAFMTSYDGHTGWANSRALALAGVTRETPDPKGGVVVRDPDGEPTGVLKEAAMALVRRIVPPPSDAEREAALRLRLAEAASFGLTSVQNASFVPAELPLFEKLEKEGALTLRISFASPMEKDPTAEALARARALRDSHRGTFIRFRAVKGMVDGVVESHTAAFLEPYADGTPSPPPLWTEEELRRAVAVYDREGLQVYLHAIGDRAIRMALDAYEAAAKENGTTGRRHRVEHVEVPHPDDLPRFRALGVIASTQAIFANPDPNTLEAYAPALGPERARRAMPFGSLDAAGAVQAFGSDWPVFPMAPLRGLYCAVTRQTPEGTPSGGWQPHERIPVEAALAHFTRDGAYASFEEDVKGRLQPGFYADFVVLSDDILAPPAERIRDAKVLRTVVGGRDVFRAPEP